MRAKNITISIIASVLIFVCYNSAFSYGYGELGEDPLITMFKNIIREAKKSDKDWDSISRLVNDTRKPIKTLDKFFNTNVSDKFNKGLKDESLQIIIKSSANLVYLSMMEKFELILRGEFKDYSFAKGRLALCDKYYREILRSNVLKYDKKNGTDLNGAILKSFKNIPNTIGKPAKFGMGKVPPQPERYKELSQNIKVNLKKVFPYFEG